jgi:hypothetical protein
MLSVGNTLWLEPLQCCRYLPYVGVHVREHSLSKKVVNCGLAVDNPGHIDKLYELCRAGGLAVPSYEKGKYFTSVQYRHTCFRYGVCSMF